MSPVPAVWLRLAGNFSYDLNITILSCPTSGWSQSMVVVRLGALVDSCPVPAVCLRLGRLRDGI